ncbi:MAG: anti-sigma factor family protein [Planctomycetales bacterium]
MITCRELIEFLGDYVASALPGDQARVFQEHLAVCPDCVTYLQEYQATIALEQSVLWETTTSEPVEPLPEGLVQAILAARASGGHPS